MKTEKNNVNRGSEEKEGDFKKERELIWNKRCFGLVSAALEKVHSDTNTNTPYLVSPVCCKVAELKSRILNVT